MIDKTEEKIQISSLPMKIRKNFIIQLGNFPKIAEVLYRIRNIFWGSPSDLFRVIMIETYSGCNRKCKYCPNYTMSRGHYYMKDNLFYKIIDELSEINYHGKVCLHLYGEPLLDKRLEKFVLYIHKKLKFARVVIYSNGDLLTIEKFENLIKAGVNFFEITQHDETISPSIKKIIKFIKENKMYNHFLNLKTQEEMKEGLDNRGGLVILKRVKKRDFCLAPSDGMSINYKGDILLCCHDYLGINKYGNAENENIIEIWNKGDYKKIRRQCAKGVYNLEICQKCGQGSI